MYGVFELHLLLFLAFSSCEPCLSPLCIDVFSNTDCPPHFPRECWLCEQWLLKYIQGILVIQVSVGAVETEGIAIVVIVAISFLRHGDNLGLRDIGVKELEEHNGTLATIFEQCEIDRARHRTEIVGGSGELHGIDFALGLAGFDHLLHIGLGYGVAVAYYIGFFVESGNARHHRLVDIERIELHDTYAVLEVDSCRVAVE